MIRLTLSVLMTCVVGLYACSAETWKRSGYETLQNVGREQCEKERSPDCPPPGSYDEYKRQRERSQSR